LLTIDIGQLFKKQEGNFLSWPEASKKSSPSQQFHSAVRDQKGKLDKALETLDKAETSSRQSNQQMLSINILFYPRGHFYSQKNTTRLLKLMKKSP
jgi:hypothetical protein